MVKNTIDKAPMSSDASAGNGSIAAAPPSVVVEREGRLGIPLLNPAGNLNSLNADVMRGVRDGFEQHGADDAVTPVLLEAEGRSFCAEGDQSSGSQGTAKLPVVTYEWCSYLAREASGLVRQLVGCDKPVVAAVQGHVYGAGIALALTADLVVRAASVAAGDQADPGPVPGFRPGDDAGNGGDGLMPSRRSRRSMPRASRRFREAQAHDHRRVGGGRWTSSSLRSRTSCAPPSAR